MPEINQFFRKPKSQSREPPVKKPQRQICALNQLAVDGTITALSAASTVANYSTNITITVSGSSMTIAWPATHLGWILQSQTNALTVGLTAPSNSWHDVSGSSGVTQMNVNINPVNPTVFYRLRHP